MISARGQFVAAFVTTMVGIVAMSVYGFTALESAADDGRRIHDDLDRLQVISDLEDDVRDLGAARDDVKRAESTHHLDGNLAKWNRLAVLPEDAPIFAKFTDAVAAAHDQKSSELWVRAGSTTGEIEDQIIRRSKKWETKEHAHRGAKQLLVIGGALVLLFGAASAFVFVRWQREEKKAREHLRRSDRLAALGTIAASVAHEINNPLATISGCATAVRDRMRRRADPCPDSIEYLEMIEDESRRCTGIVKSLSDLAREGPPASAPADLAKLARTVVALLEIDRKAKPVRYVIEGDERLDAICDPDKLKQLLLNLLLNARDASEPGGTVTLCVARVGESAARLEVRDEGRGIEKRDLARIFEPFHTDKTRGLGIGLFLCERIAAQHGGTIRAESEGRGMGARFVVEFPTRTSGQVPIDAVS